MPLTEDPTYSLTGLQECQGFNSDLDRDRECVLFTTVRGSIPSGDGSPEGTFSEPFLLFPDISDTSSSIYICCGVPSTSLIKKGFGNLVLSERPTPL